MNVFADIETLQATDESIIGRLREAARPAANLKDPAKVAASVEANFQKALLGTSLDGSYGTIACICWSTDAASIQTLQLESSAGSEPAMLEAFFDALMTDMLPGPRRPYFIGHNIGFDLRFIWRRAMVLDVPIPFDIPYNAAPWNNKYGDTMYAWSGAKDYVKLKELARILHIEDRADDLDGSEVNEAWLSGRQDEVVAHCVADVSRVRQIARRLRMV